MLKCPNCQNAFKQIKNGQEIMTGLCDNCGVLEYDRRRREWTPGKGDPEKKQEFSPLKPSAPALPAIVKQPDAIPGSEPARSPETENPIQVEVKVRQPKIYDLLFVKVKL